MVIRTFELLNEVGHSPRCENLARRKKGIESQLKSDLIITLRHQLAMAFRWGTKDLPNLAGAAICH